MLGNDLVYAPHWPRRRGTLRQRFYRKVYTEKEQKWLTPQVSTVPEIMLWSAKEALYKAHLRQGGTRGFYPLQVALEQFITPRLASFWAPSGKYRCEWQRSGAYWYCWAQLFSKTSSMKVQHYWAYQSPQDKPSSWPPELGKGSINKDAQGIPFFQNAPQRPLSKTHAGGLSVVAFHNED